MQANGDLQAGSIKRSVPPLFYTRPMLLRSGPNARSAVAVPIGVSEFPQAARHYPIAFVADDPVPVVVLGVDPGANLFVDPDGSWRPGHYVPAYVRRYPYTLTAMPDCTREMLAVDSASERFVWDVDRAEGASRFFDDEGQPTATAHLAMQDCQAYRDDGQRAEAFTKALLEAELLVRRPLPTKLLEESGFLNIDDQVFRKMTELSVTRWQRDSWLLLIALAVASGRNWKALTDLGRRRSIEQGEPA